MINDVYLRFKELYLETDAKILVQNFLLEKDPSICLKIDDNGKVINKLIAVDETVKKDELYDWFTIRNIKSKYISSNKAVGSKMIFSSNNYSLFGRIDTYPLITFEGFVKLFDVKEDKNNKKTTAKYNFFQKYKKQIQEIFQSVHSPISLIELMDKFDFISEDEKSLFQNSFITDIALNKYYEKLCDSYGCEEKQFFTEDILYKILGQIKEEIEEYAHKQIKLKIFRDVEIEKYQESELQYLKNSLFAVEDKLIEVNSNIFGQPYLDNTLNADKPFMLHQTMKLKIPFPKSQDDILYIKYLDEYLSMNKGIFYLELEKFSVSKKAFTDKEQFIIQKKKHYELFEFLPYFYDQFKKNPFTIKNHMRITKNKKLVDDKQPYTEIYLLEKDIDNLCNKKLLNNYFSDNIKGVDKRLETYIFLIRDTCFLYFKKSQITGKEFFSQIEKVISLLILYQYEKSDEKLIRVKVLENLNLKLSMQEYYKGDSMDVKSELESLNLKIMNGEEPLSDKEFLLLSGQMAYYLISQSESSNRTFRLVEHYLKSKNIETIKKHLRNDLEKYKHKINLISNKSKFKNALTMLLAYEKDKKLTHAEMDIFLIGLVSDNILKSKG